MGSRLSSSSSGGGGGSGASLLLDYAASTDIANGTSCTAGAWTDVCPNQSFTVAAGGAPVFIAVAGMAMIGGTVSANNCAVRLIVDSAGTPLTKIIGGCRMPASEYANVLGGSSLAPFVGLSAAAHTVKVQVNPVASGATLYCVPASQPTVYSLLMTVWQG